MKKKHGISWRGLRCTQIDNLSNTKFVESANILTRFSELYSNNLLENAFL